MKTITATAEDTGVADTLDTETALVDLDAQLAEELGLPGESRDEEAQSTPEDEADALEDDAEDSDDANIDDEEDDEDSEEDQSGDEDEGEEDDEEEEDSDSDEDDADDDSPPDFKSIPKEHQQMVGKLIAATKQKERAKAERQIAELTEQAESASRVPDLEAQLESVKAQKVVPAPTGDSPYADLFEAADIEAAERTLWQIKTQLIEDPDNYEINDPQADGGKRYANDQEVRRAKALVEMRLGRDLPARKAWLARHADADSALKTDLPEIDDPKSPLHRAANKVLAAMPALKTVPGYRKTAAMQVLGQQLIEAKGKDAYSFVERLLKSKAGKPKPGTPAKRANAPKPVPSRSTPRRSVAASTAQGKFDQSAYEAEILG